MSGITCDIMKINRAGAQYRTEMLAPLGLKACHASYLTEICANPGISQDRLSRRICVNKSNIARQTAVLEEGGFLLRRGSSEDKRVIELYPTEKTLEILPRIQQIQSWWEALLTQDMTEEEVNTLSQALAKMMRRAAAWTEGK